MLKLTQKEEEVMERIWEAGECTPKEVLATYDEPRPLITSISNTFQSLERKGFLTHRQQGRGYVYIPAVEKKDYGRSRLGTFIDKYFGSDYTDVVSGFVKEEKLTEVELIELLHTLINERK
jgi:predicted transcriptional regulator